ncbi:MAG: hypothetical protein ABW019_16070 [Chitinophagaceae bacterium]
MKKILVSVCAALVMTTCGFGQTDKFKTIIGQWEFAGEDGATASLTIADSATILLTYMGEQKKIVQYKMDFSKSPCWFDFAATDSGSTVQVKSLLQIVSDDILKWQLFIDEDRPQHFTSGSGEIFYLKRSRVNKDIIAAASRQ